MTEPPAEWQQHDDECGSDHRERLQRLEVALREHRMGVAHQQGADQLLVGGQERGLDDRVRAGTIFGVDDGRCAWLHRHLQRLEEGAVSTEALCRTPNRIGSEDTKTEPRAIQHDDIAPLRPPFDVRDRLDRFECLPDVVSRHVDDEPSGQRLGDRGGVIVQILCQPLPCRQRDRERDREGRRQRDDRRSAAVP